jgi:hypothetical protein
MKKFLLICLITGIGQLLFAQSALWPYSPGMTKSDQTFNVYNNNLLRHRFIIELDKGNSVEIRVHNKEHFLKLLNIDSIIQLVTTSLLPLKDSLALNELASRRIDFNSDPSGIIKIRTHVYPPAANHYVIQKNQLSALKMEQDTIMVTGFLRGKAERINFQGVYAVFPYRIIFLLNNYEQLGSYAHTSLAGIMEQIRSEWNLYKPWSEEANRRFNLYGYYSAVDPSRNRRLKNFRNADQYHTSVAPYVHIAAQGINGRFSPSVAAGIEFIASQGRSENHYQLFWEPYFYFDHSENKNKLVRNDFITFQHTNATYVTNDKKSIQFSQILSAGYLVGHKGNYLEKNTFKLGLPGMRYRDVFLHPEFLFNDLFKNFQPSLKLMLYLD